MTDDEDEDEPPPPTPRKKPAVPINKPKAQQQEPIHEPMHQNPKIFFF